MLDYEKNKKSSVRKHKVATTEFYEFYPKLSKSIIDQIDCLLAQYYGFTHEELDFIINYDIKYRVAGDADIED